MTLNQTSNKVVVIMAASINEIVLRPAAQGL
jgi:hypothetical protein